MGRAKDNKIIKKTKNNKQNEISSRINNNNKSFKQVMKVSGIIILLLLGLLVILAVSIKPKETIVDKFYKYYESSDYKIIYYYDSTNTDDEKAIYELNYLIQIGKDYPIDYLVIDKSQLSDKGKQEIENVLGINDDVYTTVVVKNKNIVALQNGFIESQKLVAFLASAQVLDNDAKYKPVDNLNFINYQDYLGYLNDDNRHIVIVGEAGCQFCMAAKPTLNNLSKGYKLTISYLDVMDFNRKEYAEFFQNLPALGYDDENLINKQTFQMPTIFIINDGKITSYLAGLKSLEEYVLYFQENGFIK